MTQWLRGDGKLQAGAVLAAAVVIAALIVLYLGDLVTWLLHVTTLDMSLNLGWQDFIQTLVLFGALIGVALLWGWLARVNVLTLGDSPAKSSGLGFALGFGGVCLAAVYAAIAGTLSSHKVDHDILLFLLGTPLVLYQCAAEEIYFRGWLQPVLGRQFGPWAGIAVTAILFAGLHYLVGAATAPLSVLNIALAGALFGLLAWRTGGLVAPVLAHFGWNWAESMWLGLSPNPGVDAYGSILNLDMTGSALWGGSEEGLNASLAVTFVLLALCAPLVLWRKPASELAAA